MIKHDGFLYWASRVSNMFYYFSVWFAVQLYELKIMWTLNYNTIQNEVSHVSCSFEAMMVLDISNENTGRGVLI